MLTDALNLLVAESGLPNTTQLENAKKEVLDCKGGTFATPPKTIDTVIGIYHEEIQRTVDRLADFARPKAITGQLILHAMLYDEMGFDSFMDSALDDLYVYALNMYDITADPFYETVIQAIAGME